MYNAHSTEQTDWEPALGIHLSDLKGIIFRNLLWFLTSIAGEQPLYFYLSAGTKANYSEETLIYQ